LAKIIYLLAIIALLFGVGYNFYLVQGNLFSTNSVILVICDISVIFGILLGLYSIIYKFIKKHKEFFKKIIASIRTVFKKIQLAKIIYLLAMIALLFSIGYNSYLMQKIKKYSERQEQLYMQMQKAQGEMQKAKEETKELVLELNKAPEIDLNVEGERKQLEDIYDDERKMLYPSIQNYIKPFAIFETERDTIRIDQIDIDIFRYSSWKLGKMQSSKPDLILEINNASFENGINTFKFRNGGKDYYDYIVSLSENMENDTLKVYHKTILFKTYHVIKLLFKGY
jgi:hypothetical protein